MLVLITVLVLGVALTIGLVANRWVRPFAKTEVQGVKLELLISPLLTLTVLLLSFVLVASRSARSSLLAGAMDEQFASEHPEVTLPCDDQGRPL